MQWGLFSLKRQLRSFSKEAGGRQKMQPLPVGLEVGWGTHGHVLESFNAVWISTFYLFCYYQVGEGNRNSFGTRQFWISVSLKWVPHVSCSELECRRCGTWRHGCGGSSGPWPRAGWRPAELVGRCSPLCSPWFSSALLYDYLAL